MVSFSRYFTVCITYQPPLVEEAAYIKLPQYSVNGKLFVSEFCSIKCMRYNLCNDDTLTTSARKYKPTLTMSQCKESEHPKFGLALASS